MRSMPTLLVLLGLAFAVSACSDTWQGLKTDTGDNVETTGQALEKAGDKIKN